MARRAIRPAGAAWLPARLAGVSISLETSVVTADADGDAVRVTTSDGRVADRRSRPVRHRVRVDTRRYPFLSPGLASRIVCANGYPVLGRGLESSVTGCTRRCPRGMELRPAHEVRVGHVVRLPPDRRPDRNRAQTMSLAPRTTAPGTIRILRGGDRAAGDGRRPGPGAVRHRRRLRRPRHRPEARRRGVPVVVVDDERTITRFSRYTSHAVQVQDLRDDEATRDTLLAAGERLGLDGWVLYPTRDEIVAAISKHRDALGATYRVPVPEWGTVRWASDKRNTYELAAREGVPAPRTWYPRSTADLADIDLEPPFAVKPAIKEHFIYATARRRGARTRGRSSNGSSSGRARSRGDDEVMVQELIPGAETTSSRSAHSSATATRWGAWSPGDPPTSRRVRPRDDVRGDRRHPDAAGAVRAAAPRDRLLRPRRARVQAGSARREYKLLDFNAGPGATTCSGPRPASTSPCFCSRTSWAGPARTSGHDRECAGSGARRTCRRRPSSSGRAG